MAKKERKIVIRNAARAAVEIIERLGLICILVDETAMYLRYGQPVPQEVKLVVVPNPSGDAPPENVGALLMQEDPTHFRIGGGKGNKQVRYHDLTGAIPAGKKSNCNVHSITMQEPPSFYAPAHVSRIENLPVVGMMPIVVDIVSKSLAQYDATSRMDVSSRRKWPSGNEFWRIENAYALQACKVHKPTTAEAALLPHAHPLLRRLLILLPTLSRKVLPLLQLYADQPAPVSHLMDEVHLALSPHEAQITGGPSIESISALNNNENGLVPPKNSKTRRRHKRKTKQSVTGHNVDAEEPHIPRTQVVCDIAKVVVRILAEHGIDCALFGSLACSLYGNQRPPNDIDMLTFPPSGVTTEAIKQILFDSDKKNFQLERSKNPRATYKILYYRIQKGLVRPGTFERNKCKVDILMPGIMHLPNLPTARIEWQDGLPMIPFSALLMQKLQAWDDHRRMASDPKKYAKRTVDAMDLQELLTLSEHVEPLRFSKPWSDKELFSDEFERLCVQRAKYFCFIYPQVRSDFVLLGFQVSL